MSTQSLCGDIEEDRVLEAGEYLMACSVFVLDGVTLTIFPGVTVRSVPKDQDGGAPCLVVRRGGRVIANGTVDRPITFTAIETSFDSGNNVITDTAGSSNGTTAQRLSGKWGGVIIAGRAPTAYAESNPVVEGMPVAVPYGGNDPFDDSGILRYVRIWHGGAVVYANNEINGLTLAGVGQGTVVENVEVAFSLDDGVEMFGGTASLRRVSVLFVGDDSFDVDFGYQGFGQYLFAVIGNSGDKGLEVDSGVDDDLDSQPRSHPAFFSFTFLGGGPAGRGGDLVLLRQGSGAALGASILAFGEGAGYSLQRCGAAKVRQDLPQIGSPSRRSATAGNHVADGFIYISPDSILSHTKSVFDFDSSCIDGSLNGSSLQVFDAGSADLFRHVNASCLDYECIDAAFDPLPLADGPACSASFDLFPADSFYTRPECFGAFSSPEDDWLSGWSWLSVTYSSPSSPPPPMLPPPAPASDDSWTANANVVLAVILSTFGTLFSGLAVYLLCRLSWNARERRKRRTSRQQSAAASKVTVEAQETPHTRTPSSGTHEKRGEPHVFAQSLPAPASQQLSAAEMRQIAKSSSGRVNTVMTARAEALAPPPPPVPEDGKNHFVSPTESLSAPSMFSSLKAWRAFRDFEEVREIGRGTQGRALLLRNKHTGQLVVSKQVWAADLTDERLERVEREVRILSSLKHPHIIRYLASFQKDEVLCIITEYAAGGTLRIAIRQQNRLKQPFHSEQIIVWLAQLASALYAVHAANVLHRDIKAENVFLSGDADIKLGDFGLSQQLDDAKRLAETTCGTPYYISPEQVSGKGYSQPADIWAVGVLVFELITLTRPFTADSFGELATTIQNCDYNEEVLAAAKHPAALKGLVTRDAMLHVDAEKRTTLAQLLGVLRGLLAPVLGPVHATESAPENGLDEDAPPADRDPGQVRIDVSSPGSFRDPGCYHLSATSAAMSLVALPGIRSDGGTKMSDMWDDIEDHKDAAEDFDGVHQDVPTSRGAELLAPA